MEIIPAPAPVETPREPQVVKLAATLHLEVTSNPPAQDS